MMWLLTLALLPRAGSNYQSTINAEEVQEWIIFQKQGFHLKSI